jgi:hypothetical protein
VSGETQAWPAIREKVLMWLATGEVGTSSQTMAFIAAGLPMKHPCHPLDPADFNRCLKVVREIPEIRNSFQKIAALSPEWKGVIDNWERIEKSFIDECGWDWSSHGVAEKTYELMDEIEKAARATT